MSLLCEVEKLPTDIQRRIIKFLDIDTRRIIGVYSKIGKPPFNLDIVKPLIIDFPTGDWCVSIILGKKKLVSMMNSNRLNIIPLYRINYLNLNDNMNISVLYRNNENNTYYSYTDKNKYKYQFALEFVPISDIQ
jgi:hypothetical protein